MARGHGHRFVLGLCMDVHQSSLLGQHALAYTVLMYGTACSIGGCCGCVRCSSPGRWWVCSRPPTRPTCWQAFWRGGACRVGVSCWRLCWRPSCGPWSAWMLLAPQRRSVDGQDKLP
jgi:hypothetical protein